MQFKLATIIAFTFGAAIAAAAPAPAPAATVTDLSAQAEASLHQLEANGCNVLKCLAALAPEYVTCAAALAEAGANPLADAACFATALNNLANKPAGCKGC